MLKQWLQGVDQQIWQADMESRPLWQRELVRFAQIVLLTGRDLSHGMLTLRAMGLVYTTLLSFVPLIAVSFSVLKGFGVHNQVEPMLLNFLAPLGDKSEEITRNIVGFVENMKIGVLGALGLGLLLYTVVSLIQKIEAALNFTWRLTSVRRLSQRVSNYLSIIMVGPVLIFSALGITATLKSNTMISAIETLPYMGEVIPFLGRLVPYAMIIAAFAFVYMLVPNTRVKVKSALYGAIIAGLMWRSVGALFASFASGSTSYTAIYSGFAIVLLFMIWLYLGWLILLIGASISYYHQHPEKLRWQQESTHMSGQLRENLALQLMLAVGRDHVQPSDSPSNISNLSMMLKVPEMMVSRMLNTLLDSGFIVQTNDASGRFLPARSIEQIRLVDIIDTARLAEDHGILQQMSQDAEVLQVAKDINHSQRQVLGEKTLKDLIHNNER